MKVTIKQPSSGISTVLGIPGPEGPPGPPGIMIVSNADDVDSTTLVTGSLLIYDAIREKWVADTFLSAQFIECGEY